MFERYLFSVTFTATIGCGIVAGVFFAFSTFVMPALARLQPDRGIVAMQSVNITAINPPVHVGVVWNGWGLHLANYCLTAQVASTQYCLFASW
jgi:uncharacterized membrane protein